MTWSSRSAALSWTNAGADGTGSHKAPAEGISAGSTLGPENEDVTTSIQNRSKGEASHGWVLVDTGTNGVDFDSSENLTIANRPKLTVAYAPHRPPLQHYGLPDLRAGHY